MIKVDANLFRLAYSAVSKEETRYYLNGVSIEPNPNGPGAMLISTDGHRMVVIHDHEGICDTKIIVKVPQYALALCKSGRRLTNERRVLTVDRKASSATVAVEHIGKSGAAERTDMLASTYNVVIDGTFPDWRNVAPKAADKPIGAAGFNSRYLAELARFGSELGASVGREGMYFLCEGKDGIEPVVVRFSGVANAFAVLMPMRIDYAPGLPDFMTGKPIAAAA